MTPDKQPLMPESVNRESVAAFFERERVSEDRAVNVIRSYIAEERRSAENFNQINADCVEHFLASAIALRSRVSTLTDQREPTRYDQVPNGCWVACIAGLTGLPHDGLAALIPRVENGDYDGSRKTEYHNAVNEYLRERAWRLLYCGFDTPRGYAMAYGQSPRNIFHSVIVKDGELWHDPHPSRAGLLSVEQYEILIPLARPANV